MQLGKLKAVLEGFRSKRILVIGDIMVDHYLWGTIDRISPEAPVPVVDVSKEEYRLGGAANVAANIKSLGAEPYLIGVTGNDRYYSELCSLLEGVNIGSEYIIKDHTRPTTLKSRIIAHNQQILRIDYESKKDVDGVICDRIIEMINTLSNEVDCIIIEDYNKGLLTPKLIRSLIDQATKKGVIVTVDPKFKNFFAYYNCTLFKPNFSELQKNSGIPIESDKDMDIAADKVLNDMNSAYLIVTRGEKGLTIYRKDKKRIDIPTFAQDIYDVSGAGDTVISTISLALCCGLKIEEAAMIANHAAGSVCSKIGIQPVCPEDVINSFVEYNKRLLLLKETKS